MIRQTCIATLFALGLGTLARAADAPHRPYPDLPDVLYYDGFEGAEVKDLYKGGTFQTNSATAPTPGTPPNAPTGDHCLKVKASDDKNNKKVNFYIETGKARMTLMGNLEPNRVSVGFKYYSDARCETWLVVHTAAGDYIDKQSLNETKGGWNNAQFKFSDTRNKTAMLKPDTGVSSIEIAFFPKPPNPDKFPNVMVDDFIVAYNTPAEQALPLVLAKELRNRAIEKNPEKDGFAYTPNCVQNIPTLLKNAHARRLRKTVLVMGSNAEESTALAKNLEMQAPKKKLMGYKFVPAMDGDGGGIGGLEDSRLLLPGAMQKANSGLVLIVIPPSDGNDKKASDSLRAVVDRVTSMGGIPIVCLPKGPAGDKDPVANFNNSMRNQLASIGLPWIEQGSAGKAAGTGDNLLEGVTAVTITALQTMAETLPPNM